MVTHWPTSNIYYLITMNKVNAFTLFELVVSLTVSAILIAIVYTSLDVIQKRFESTKRKHQQNYAERLIQKIMDHDIEKCGWVTASANHVNCHIDSNRAIQYTISDSVLTRIDSITIDTLSKNVWNVKHWFQNEERLDSSLADLIWIEMNDEKVYTFKKWYAADMLIHF